MRFPDVSVVVDLSGMPEAERLEYVPSLLAVLASARRQRGFPHRIVVDEAHYFLHAPEAVDVLDLEMAAYTLATYKVARLDPRLLESTEAIIVTRESDPGEARALQAVLGGEGPEERWRETLAALQMDEAVLVTTRGPGSGRLQRFRTASRLTPHVRHRHKYTDVPVAPGEAFVFTRDGARMGPPARTLTEFSRLVGRCAPDVLEGHLRRHDFSRWIAKVYRDRTLAAQVFALEGEREQRPASAGAALVALIFERYILAGAEGLECAPAIESVPA